MTLRDLKYIIAVSETHHFGKAAERCFVSQPTLSGQIKILEEELGITLFDEPFGFAHPPQHRFHDKQEITQTDLDDVELLLLSEGHYLAEQAMSVCKMKEPG